MLCKLPRIVLCALPGTEPPRSLRPCGEILFGCGWAALCSSVFICGFLLCSLGLERARDFGVVRIAARRPAGERRMEHGLNIRQEGALDFVSLGALVHRLDPGFIPFRKAGE